MLKDYIRKPAEALLLHVYALPDMKISVSEIEAMGDEGLVAAQALVEDELLAVCDCESERRVDPDGRETIVWAATVYGLTPKGRIQARYVLEQEAKDKAAAEAAEAERKAREEEQRKGKRAHAIKQAFVAAWELIKTFLPFC